MSHYPKALVPVDHVEPVARRIRATIGPHTVLDTVRALYLWEWPYYPQYYIPAADIDAALIDEEEGTHRLKRGTVARLSISTGDVRRERVAHRYLESTVPEIVGMVRFDWDALDAWFEEDEQVFVHPRNPYVRVDALRSTRHVRVELDGVALAESRAPVLVFETGLPTRWYFDRSAVDFSLLEPSDLRTPCPYKGVTSAYWSVRIGDRLHRDLAWSYDFPTLPLAPIAGLVAFYDEQVDVVVDGVRQDRPRTHFFT